jgi:hypothetical protein
MAEITLEFLAAQQEKILQEIGTMRDDMRVLAAMVQRLDGTVTGLVNEVRAEHARYSRLENRVRALEGAP